jgi:hypothetical protein
MRQGVELPQLYYLCAHNIAIPYHFFRLCILHKSTNFFPIAVYNEPYSYPFRIACACNICNSVVASKFLTSKNS